MLKRILNFLLTCIKYPSNKDIKFAIKILKKNKVAKKNIKIDQKRKILLKNCSEIKGEDFGKGSRRYDKQRICDILKVSVSGKKKCAFIQALVEFYNVKKVIEFGTSLGFSAMYMKNANTNPHVITIEGNEGIARIARNNFDELDFDIELKIQNFDDFIKNFSATKKIDLFYIDGNHQYDATFRYFEFSLRHLKSDGIVIFDDIRWSDDMLKVWRDIISQAKTGIFIDIGSMGIFINSDSAKKIFCNIFFL